MCRVSMITKTYLDMATPRTRLLLHMLVQTDRQITYKYYTKNGTILLRCDYIRFSSVFSRKRISLSHFQCLKHLNLNYFREKF